MAIGGSFCLLSRPHRPLLYGNRYTRRVSQPVRCDLNVDSSCNRLCDYFPVGRQVGRSRPVWRAGGSGPPSCVPRPLLASSPARRRPILSVGTDAPPVGARARAAPCRAFALAAPARRGRSPCPPGGGWLLLSLSLSPQRRRAAAARLHARSRGRAAAAPQRALRPAPAPFGGDGRGGATRGGQYKTACRGGWPPPTQGRQRPVLLAHPTRPPYVLGCTSQRGIQRPSSSSKTRRIWPSPRRAACRLRLLNRTFPASSPAPLSAAATNAPHRHGKELGRYGRAGSPASRLVFRLLYLFFSLFPQGRLAGQLVAMGVLV